MGRFDPPKPVLDPAITAIQASLDQLAATILDRVADVAPVSPLAPVTAPAPAPVVHVTSPPADMSPVAEAMGRFEAILDKLANVPVRDDQVTVNLAPLHDSMEKVREAIGALEASLVDKVAGKRSHFDGRLRNNDGLISPTNPLDVTSTGGGGLTDAELRAADVKITLDGEPVAVTGTQTDGLTDAELRATPVPVSGTVSVTDLAWTAYTGTKTTAAEATVVTPAAGDAVRLGRVWLQADAALDTGTVVVTVRLDGSAVDVVELTGSQPYVNPDTRAGGADGTLTIECSSTASVRYNFSVQEFTP